MDSKQHGSIAVTPEDADLRQQARARGAVVQFMDSGDKGEGWYVQYHGGAWNALHPGPESEAWERLLQLMCLTQPGDLVMSSITVEGTLKADTPALTRNGGDCAVRYDIREVDGEFLVLRVASQATSDGIPMDVWQTRCRPPLPDFGEAARLVRGSIRDEQCRLLESTRAWTYLHARV